MGGFTRFGRFHWAAAANTASPSSYGLARGDHGRRGVVTAGRGWVWLLAALFSSFVAFFDVRGLRRGASSFSADLGKMVVTKGTTPNAEEGAARADHAGCTPTVQVVSQVRLLEAASPRIGASLRDRLPHASGQDVSLPCCRAARTDARHRAQVSRFLDAAIGGDAISSANCVPKCSQWKRGKGRSSSTSIKPTVASKVKLDRKHDHPRPKKKAPEEEQEQAEEVRAAVVPLFRDGLADYPQRNSSAVFRELLHRGLLQGEEDRAPQADRTGRSTYPPVAFAPKKLRRDGSGDTAFDAEAVRTACEERKFSWIVPINPERVLAGAKPRPKVVAV